MVCPVENSKANDVNAINMVGNLQYVVIPDLADVTDVSADKVYTARAGLKEDTNTSLPYEEVTRIHFQKTYGLMQEMMDETKFQASLPTNFNFLDIACAPGGFSQRLLDMQEEGVRQVAGCGITLEEQKGGFPLLVESDHGAAVGGTKNTNASSTGATPHKRYVVCFHDLLANPGKVHVPSIPCEYDLAIADGQYMAEKSFVKKGNSETQQFKDATCGKIAMLQREFQIAFSKLKEAGIFIFRFFTWEKKLPVEMWRLYYLVFDLFESVEGFKSERFHAMDGTFYTICTGFNRSKYLNLRIHECLECSFVELFQRRAVKAYNDADLEQLEKEKEEFDIMMEIVRQDGDKVKGMVEDLLSKTSCNSKLKRTLSFHEAYNVKNDFVAQQLLLLNDKKGEEDVEDADEITFDARYAAFSVLMDCYSKVSEDDQNNATFDLAAAIKEQCEINPAKQFASAEQAAQAVLNDAYSNYCNKSNMRRFLSSFSKSASTLSIPQTVEEDDVLKANNDEEEYVVVEEVDRPLTPLPREMFNQNLFNTPSKEMNADHDGDDGNSMDKQTVCPSCSTTKNKKHLTIEVDDVDDEKTSTELEDNCSSVNASSPITPWNLNDMESPMNAMLTSESPLNLPADDHENNKNNCSLQLPSLHLIPKIFLAEGEYTPFSFVKVDDDKMSSPEKSDILDCDADCSAAEEVASSGNLSSAVLHDVMDAGMAEYIQDIVTPSTSKHGTSCSTTEEQIIFGNKHDSDDYIFIVLPAPLVNPAEGIPAIINDIAVNGFKYACTPAPPPVPDQVLSQATLLADLSSNNYCPPLPMTLPSTEAKYEAAWNHATAPVLPPVQELQADQMITQPQPPQMPPFVPGYNCSQMPPFAPAYCSFNQDPLQAAAMAEYNYQYCHDGWDVAWFSASPEYVCRRQMEAFEECWERYNKNYEINNTSSATTFNNEHSSFLPAGYGKIVEGNEADANELQYTWRTVTETVTGYDKVISSDHVKSDETSDSASSIIDDHIMVCNIETMYPEIEKHEKFEKVSELLGRVHKQTLINCAGYARKITTKSEDEEKMTTKSEDEENKKSTTSEDEELSLDEVVVEENNETNVENENSIDHMIVSEKTTKKKKKVTFQITADVADANRQLGDEVAFTLVG